MHYYSLFCSIRAHNFSIWRQEAKFRCVTTSILVCWYWLRVWQWILLSSWPSFSHSGVLPQWRLWLSHACQSLPCLLRGLIEFHYGDENKKTNWCVKISRGWFRCTKAQICGSPSSNFSCQGGVACIDFRNPPWGVEKVVHLLLLLVALLWLLEAASMTSALDSCLGKVLEGTWNNYDPTKQKPALACLLRWDLSVGVCVGLGFWTMPWKCAWLQTELNTAKPSATATTSLLDWCSFLAWDRSGWWTAGMAHWSWAPWGQGLRAGPQCGAAHMYAAVAVAWAWNKLPFARTCMVFLLWTNAIFTSRPCKTFSNWTEKGHTDWGLWSCCFRNSNNNHIPDFSVLSQANFHTGYFF